MSTKSYLYTLSGIRCASCTAKIEKTLMEIPGVLSVSMNFANKSVSISADDSTTPEHLIKSIEQLGYGAAPVQNNDEQENNDHALERKHYYNLLLKTVVA